MDDKKMSCGQEVGMSSGEAPMPCLYMDGSEESSCAAAVSLGDFSMKSVITKTICKVPQRIRQAIKYAYDPYEPHIVSIGPYHQSRKNEVDEEHKRKYQNEIFSRCRPHSSVDYSTKFEESADKARRCYSDDVGHYDFLDMMVTDGCFIVELFLRFREKEKKEKEFEDDPIFSRIWMLPLIRYDMLLLENQIPFFVLETVYEMASPGNGSLVELALDFFKPIIPMKNKENKIEVSINGDYFHLLHLLHSYLIPTPRVKSKKCKILMFLCSKGSNEAESPTSNNRSPTIKNEAELPISNNRPPPIKNEADSNNRPPPITMIPCAAELQLAGVKFKKRKDFSSFLEVKFSGGVLEIPHLCIDDYTNTLLRNLVALEQICYPGVKTIHFTNYVGFMDCLINTSKDVALLHRSGIINHLLGSDAHVARLFNQLCYGIFNDFEDHNYLSGVYKDVDKYYNTPWNMCWASLRSDYFTNPWASLSSAAAVILILLTMAQTFYTIFPYYRPGS